MTKQYTTTKNLLKFILGSAFGILMFLVPIPQGESFTTLLDFVKGFINTCVNYDVLYPKPLANLNRTPDYAYILAVLLIIAVEKCG